MAPPPQKPAPRWSHPKSSPVSSSPTKSNAEPAHHRPHQHPNGQPRHEASSSPRPAAHTTRTRLGRPPRAAPQHSRNRPTRPQPDYRRARHRPFTRAASPRPIALSRGPTARFARRPTVKARSTSPTEARSIPTVLSTRRPPVAAVSDRGGRRWPAPTRPQAGTAAGGGTAEPTISLPDIALRAVAVSRGPLYRASAVSAPPRPGWAARRQPPPRRFFGAAAFGVGDGHRQAFGEVVAGQLAQRQLAAAHRKDRGDPTPAASSSSGVSMRSLR